MQNLLRLVFGVLWMLAVTGVPQKVSAQVPDSLQAKISNINYQGEGVQRGIRGILVTFDLFVPRPGQSELPVFIADPGPYHLFASVLDQSGQPVFAADDARFFKGAKGICRDSIRFIVPEKGSRFNQLELFIPFYAMDLRTGMYDLKVKVEVRDVSSGRLIQEEISGVLPIIKPPLKLLRMSLKQFYVDSTDKSAGNWDFHLLNAEESKPDPEWKLARGRYYVYKPKKRKNTLFYDGNSDDLTPLFTLSQGDKLELIVEDFDLTSYSDQIGSLEIDPWAKDFAFNTFQEKSFGQVKNLVFAFFGFYLPELEMNNLRTETHVQEDGVTGNVVQFDFAVKSGNRKVAGFYMELFHFLGASREIPRFTRVLSGPAILDKEGHLILEDDEGTVRLFIPHYGLMPGSGAVPGYLELVAKVGIDEQRFTVIDRVLRLPAASNTEINDMFFSRYEVKETVRNGATGLEISSLIRIPEYYVEDLPKGKFWLRAGIFTPWGQADPAAMYFPEPGEARIEGANIHLPVQKKPYFFRVFIPYHSLKPQADSFLLRTTFSVRKGTENEEMVVGQSVVESQITTSQGEMVRIRVPEVKPKTYKWMLEGPKMRWRVKVGDEVMYESPVIYNSEHPKWDLMDQAEFLAFPADIIRIEIMHLSKGHMEHLLGLWKGTPAELFSGQGRLRLEERMPGLRKSIIIAEKP